MKKLLLFLILIAGAAKAQTAVNLYAYLPERTLMTGCAIFFGPNYSDHFSIFEDALTLSNPLENISSVADGKLLSINKRRTEDTVPLVLYNLRDLKYELEIINYQDGMLFDDGKKSFVVGDTLIYEFNADTTVISLFKLSFPKCVLLIDDNRTIVDTLPPALLYPNPATSYVNIVLKEYGVYIISLPNRLYLVNQLSNQPYKLDVSYLSRGVHFVGIRDSRGKLTIQKLIKL